MWNETLLKEYDRLYEMGKSSIFSKSPYYNGIRGYRRAFIEYEMSANEMTDWKRYNALLVDDTVKMYYFTMWSRIQYYPLQKIVFASCLKERFNCIHNARQTGISEALLVSLMDYIMTQSNKAIYIFVSKKSNNTFLERFLHLYAKMPFFMKPGIVKKSLYNISFDNGCHIRMENYKCGMPGYTVDWLLMLDATYTKERIFVNTCKHVLPVIAATRTSKVTLQSNFNGQDFFSRMRAGKHDIINLKSFNMHVFKNNESNNGKDTGFMKEYIDPLE